MPKIFILSNAQGKNCRISAGYLTGIVPHAVPEWGEKSNRKDPFQFSLVFYYLGHTDCVSLCHLLGKNLELVFNQFEF